ncbi:2-C-methyl-D-erythritol 4-phosphate cytidylyltransferase [bacterium]|nr:2-C-methyl-D-erythritol 4-phosphate cytidylyltransferase [bacterium]
MSVKAIIVAAGSGRRVGGPLPKQYMHVSGMPILVHTLLAFQRSELVDEIIPVVGKADAEWVKENILHGKGLTKTSGIVKGGAERQDSVYCGLKYLWDNVNDNDIVLVHDGARPFIQKENIHDCINGAKRTGACILGIRIMGTLKIVDEGDIIKSTLPSKDLWVAQTPQAFRASLIKEAYIMAEEQGFYGTDDASLVERLPYSVKIIPGHPLNIKVTYPEDLDLAERIMKIMEMRKQA